MCNQAVIHLDLHKAQVHALARSMVNTGPILHLTAFISDSALGNYPISLRLNDLRCAIQPISVMSGPVAPACFSIYDRMIERCNI